MISPPILGQTSVQIEISYIQKGREGHLTWGSYLAFSSSPVEVIWHCYAVLFWCHTTGMIRNPRIPSTAHTTPLTSHLPQTVICLRITVIIIPILQWRHMSLRVQRLGRPRRDFGSWLHHTDRVQRHDPGFSALLPWTELQRAIEASLPNPSFYRRKIWPLKVYIDWKRCATCKHIKPGARFQYSHTAEGNSLH